MSFRIVHALWDDKEGRVALFLNPDDQFARWRTRYEIYLTVGGQHGGHREFLGIFDATKPVARDWPDLPPWVMLPVLRGAISAFSLELQPHRPGTGAGPIRLDFDATVIFDYRRRGVLDEERFYCWQADSSGGRAGAFERKRHLFIMDQRAEDIAGAQVLEGDFVNAFVDIAAAQARHTVTRMLAYTVREGRIGPAKEIKGANARREIPVKAEFDQRRFPTLDELRALAADAGQETDSIDTKAFRSIVIEAEAYEQPRLSLRLGSSERGARRLQDRITFLHIPTNQISALRAIQTTHSPTSPEAVRTDWIGRILGLSSIAGARDPLDLLFDAENNYVRHGGDLPLLAERRGDTQIYYLDHTFDHVAMGDIVGIFVHDNVRLDYPSQRTESGEDSETKSSFSSLYLRFLIDRLEPMDTERVILEYSEEIGDVLSRVKRQLMARVGDHHDDDTGPPTDGFLPSSTSGPSRGLRLTELLGPALDSVLIEEDRRRHGRNPGRLRAVMTADDFHRLPNVAHALCVTDHFGNRVKEVGRRPPESEPGFCVASLHMAGGTELARSWVKANASAPQQATIWQMFEIDPNFVEDCARLHTSIPTDYRPDPDVLRDLYALLHQPQRLERAMRIFAEFERGDYARRILSAADAFQGRSPGDGARALSLEDLEAVVGLTRFADDLVREEIDRAMAILAACKLQTDAIDISSVHISGQPDRQRLTELRARTTHVITRKLGPGVREQYVADAQRFQSEGVLHFLVERLEIVDHRSEILRFVLGTADAVTQWANQSSDTAVSNGRPYAYPPMGETDWDQIRLSLRAPEVLPDALQIRRLADPQGQGGVAVELAGNLAQCAAALQRLIAEARAEASRSISGGANGADREINEQFTALERYASVALATLTARQLASAAQRIGDYLSGAQSIAGADLQALAESWNGLGRALAPDRALHALPEALRHADSFLRKAAPHIDPASSSQPLVELPPPPSYEEVRQSLAA